MNCITSVRPARLLTAALVIALAGFAVVVDDAYAAAPLVNRIEAFESISFTADAVTTQSLVTPPLQGTSALAVTYTGPLGTARLSKQYAVPLDLRGKYLHLDVKLTSSTLAASNSPKVKLLSGSRVVMDTALPVRRGEWTGLTFNLANLNQTQLSRIDRIEIYVTDLAPLDSVTFELDDMYISSVPMPPQRSVLTFMLVGWYPELDATYKTLESAKTHFAFRSREYSINDPSIRGWDTRGTRYYYTAASSDYPHYDQLPLYAPLADVKTVLARPASEGIYLHEVVSYLAMQNGWNWPLAASQVDWAWMDQMVSAAAARGKQVVWLEPAHGWNALSENASAQQFFAKWKSRVSPGFGTNFYSSQSGYLMAEARDYAQAVAGKYGIYMGQGHQGWHFWDQGAAPTRAGSLALARLGYDAKATYYGMEGTREDMAWDSPYMLGIRDFRTWLLTQ